MSVLEGIRVPVALVLVLSFCVVCFLPIYPVDVQHEQERIPCQSNETCTSLSEYVEVDPPILVMSSGFSWSAHGASADSVSRFSYSASPLLAPLLLILPILVILPWILKEKGETRWRRITIRRRSWRILLWALGVCFLMLSGYWSWNYALFYGSLTSSAAIDPFLTSMLVTFLLYGIGMATMTLAVRSRALWPLPRE